MFIQTKKKRGKNNEFSESNFFSKNRRAKNQGILQSNFFSKNRKGVSPMIGYILLVTFVIVLGTAVYSWAKTYIPQEELNCPDGASLFVKEYECSADTLNLTIKNNGKFSIGGYFVYATTAPDQELATRDLSFYSADNVSVLSPNGIKFEGELNSLTPNAEESDVFNITDLTIYSVEIIPIRWQRDNRVNRLVSCQDAKVSETLVCN